MTKRLRRIRSAFLTGLTWAFAWSFIGTSFMVLLGVDHRATTDMINPYAGMGLIGGGAFSVFRRRFDEMSLPRFAAWGAAGGLLLSVLFGPETLVTLSIGTLLGAGSAAGSMVLVRRADEMSLPRFAAWGAVAGLLLSMPFWGAVSSNLGGVSLAINLVIDVVQVCVMALMWAGCAAGALALARNAHDGDLLEAGGSAGLIEGE